jgi:hypothetical protein
METCAFFPGRSRFVHRPNFETNATMLRSACSGVGLTQSRRQRTNWGECKSVVDQITEKKTHTGPPAGQLGEAAGRKCGACGSGRKAASDGDAGRGPRGVGRLDPRTRPGNECGMILRGASRTGPERLHLLIRSAPGMRSSTMLAIACGPGDAASLRPHLERIDDRRLAARHFGRQPIVMVMRRAFDDV